MDMSLSQIGLLLDAFGFIVVFFFGGFSFGIDMVYLGGPKWFVLPAKIIGSLMVVAGFILQFLGAS